MKEKTIDQECEEIDQMLDEILARLNISVPQINPQNRARRKRKAA